MTTAWFGPLKPYLIETWPQARLISAEGMKNGLTRRGPRFSRISVVSAMVLRPPMPEPIMTPVRQRLLLALRLPARILDRLHGGSDAVDDEVVDLRAAPWRVDVVGRR